MFRNVFSGCVSDRSSQAEVFRSQKLKFGASLSSALKHGYLPGPLVDILVHIAREGVLTTDVFRRPGNPNDTRRIVKRLTEGKQVIYANYSFYTLASVVKKFLLKIPGGIFTPEGEEHLLQVLAIAQKMEQIESVHSFIETLTPAHQQLVALLFGTWFRIVTYQEQNCMSVEALSRSVAGSMFHTCAEDPAKVERASRIMQFLIDNFGVESMFGQNNVRFFVETTHTGLHIQGLYHYGFVSEAQRIPPGRSEFIEMTRMEKEEEEDDEYEDRGLGREREFSESPQLSPTALRHSRDEIHESQLINTSTLSAPEVSLVPSPQVSKRPKSLEDNLNEVRSHYQSRCLSRFNSVKRKQLERLRQRSDWFLSPTVRERNNSRKGKGEWGLSHFSSSSGQSSGQHRSNGNSEGKTNGGNINLKGSGKVLQAKNSGNSVVTKASSEGAVLEAFSDGDSVFTDNTSRSESPASEPVWSHILKVHSRDIIHSDTGVLAPPEMSLYGGSSGADLSIDSHDNISGQHFGDLSPPLVRSQLVEEEEEGTKGDDEDEDDDNNTPTGVQDEEDTIMASSILDLHHNSSTDKGSACSQDSPLDSFGDNGEETKLKRQEGGSSIRSQTTSTVSIEMSEQSNLLQGQQTTQHEQAEFEPGVEAAATEQQQQQEAPEDDADVVGEQTQSSLVTQSSGGGKADS